MISQKIVQQELSRKGGVRFAFDSQKYFELFSKDIKNSEKNLERAMGTLAKINRDTPSAGMQKQSALLVDQLRKVQVELQKLMKMGSNII